MKKLIIASILLLPIVIWLLLKFLFISPEERIKQVIYDLVDAVKNEEAEEALSYVSKDYGDETGLDYSQIEHLAEETSSWAASTSRLEQESSSRGRRRDGR